MSTSTSQGDPDGACQSNRTKPKIWPGCCHTFKRPDRPLSILGSRIAFQLPTRTVHFEASRNDPNCRKKGRLFAVVLGPWIVAIQNSKVFTATSATTSRPPSPAKTRLTVASRLRPTSRETPAPQRLPNAEKTTKSPSSTRQCWTCWLGGDLWRPIGPNQID